MTFMVTKKDGEKDAYELDAYGFKQEFFMTGSDDDKGPAAVADFAVHLAADSQACRFLTKRIGNALSEAADIWSLDDGQLAVVLVDALSETNANLIEIARYLASELGDEFGEVIREHVELTRPMSGMAVMPVEDSYGET